MRRLFNDKKAQTRSGDRIIDSVITLVIVAAIIAGTATLVLQQFTNLSNAGLALGILFATVLPLLYAVNAFKSVRESMRF
ncbi:MAG: hypothetical protein GTO02_13550 [Candidatus Dadabacteria bacterium]|nr:hypothetical protein [Candidatus Dadabacteria bacterium]